MDGHYIFEGGKGGALKTSKFMGLEASLVLPLLLALQRKCNWA